MFPFFSAQPSVSDFFSSCVSIRCCLNWVFACFGITHLLPCTYNAFIYSYCTTLYLGISAVSGSEATLDCIQRSSKQIKFTDINFSFFVPSASTAAVQCVCLNVTIFYSHQNHAKNRNRAEVWKSVAFFRHIVNTLIC